MEIRAAYEDEGAIRIRCRTRERLGGTTRSKGWIEFPNEKLEDLVLVRSDGRPTYNFASPLEDWLDGITHVIRGDDHVSNTPKQIVVLQALGADPPDYAHVPNVFGTDGKQALAAPRGPSRSTSSRRRVRIGTGADELPHPARLELRRPDDDHVRDELVERFSLERVGSSPATFDYSARVDERPVHSAP